MPPMLPLSQKLFDSCCFRRFENRVRLNFLDAMCGKGLVGLAIKQKLSQQMPLLDARTAFYFNDISPEPMAMKAWATVIIGDVCCLVNTYHWHFDIALVRYGFSNLPEPRLNDALRSLFNSMLPDGRLVVTNPAAFTPEGRKWLREIYLRNPRLIELTGSHENDYIALPEELASLISSAGFKNTMVMQDGIQEIGTRDWKDHIRSVAECKRLIKGVSSTIHEICSKTPAFRNEFQVSFKDDSVTLRLPRIIITADR